MIPNHQQFIDAIKDKYKICLRFYSTADSGLVDRVYVPLKYGPGSDEHNAVNRYWFWDPACNPGVPSLGLLPEQVIDLRVLGEHFDPATYSTPPLDAAVLSAVEPDCVTSQALPSMRPAQARQPGSSEPERVVKI